MNSVNKVTLLGNLVKDPEVRSFQNGGKVANMVVATSENWKDKTTGEKKEKSEFHRVSVTNEGLVGVIEKFLKKGSKVYIEGQIETRKWTDSSGKDNYSTEIVIKPYHGELVICSFKNSVDTEEKKEYVPVSTNEIDDDIPF